MDPLLPQAEKRGVELRKILGEHLPWRRATGQLPGAQLFLEINSWPQIQVGMRVVVCVVGRTGPPQISY